MKYTKKNPPLSGRPGFALIATISVMVLLVMVALAMLSLGTLELRSGGQRSAEAEARANARMGLMLAIAELQKSAGPDQSITASASILDDTPDSEQLTGFSGLGSARVLGVWGSWNTWLNAKDNGEEITDTYQKGRNSRFRRWLVSHQDDKLLVDAATPTSGGFGFNKDNAVELHSRTDTGEETNRVFAGLINVIEPGKTDPSGRYAWWIGGQNQKANARSVQAIANAASPAAAELKNGSPAPADITAVKGFENMPSDPASVEKLIDFNAMGTKVATSPQVPEQDLRNSFHDIAVDTGGLLADVRWGGLKKDLNLLLERTALPAELTRKGRSQAPSPRPRSADIMAFNPRLAHRGFSSFEQMREYYRIYRSGAPYPFKWTGGVPTVPNYLGHGASGDYSAELSGYRRTPVILKFYCVYSLRSERIPNSVSYNHDLVFTTVVALWNPYNAPLELPGDQYKTYTLPYKILPTQYIGYVNGTQLNPNWINMVQGSTIYDMGRDFAVRISGTNGGSVRFEPGQIRIFSKKGLNYGSEGANLDLTPGFDPSAAYGQRIRVYSNKPPSNTKWQVSLRLTPLWNQDGTAIYWGGNPGAFGNLLRDKGNGWGDPPTTVGTMFDWTAGTLDYVKIAPTTSSALATFQPGVKEAIPFAVVGVGLKTSVRSVYDNSPSPNIRDYRSKNWINGLNAVAAQKMNITYTNANLRELQRLNHGYQLHFSTVNGQNDLGQYFTRDATNTLTSLGTGIGSELVQSAPVLELPTVPATSLAGFAGMRLTPGWYDIPPNSASSKGNANSMFGVNTVGYVSGVPGVGIGNSFAHPMIPGDKVYAYHDVSKLRPQSKAPGSNNPPASNIDSNAFSDYWDHALLVNDGLWDSWFTSSMVDAQRPTDGSASSQGKTISDFYTKGTPLPYPHYIPVNNGKAPKEIATLLESADGYKSAAAYLSNEYSFNVNSTSHTAWRALFSRLQDNRFAYRNASGKLSVASAPTGQAAVTRFMTSPAAVETDDIQNGTNVPGIGRMWTGVRFLTSDQLDKLAEECVRQVKLRGPFLNMSDFINRRLSSGELGLRGALQAAIDYDDGNPDSSSINYRYKGSDDMIADSDHTFADYPFEAAANGSRFTGVPGYVVQSDILRPLGNSLSVRDDTFVIRAYGEALDPSDPEKVLARAWCEATVTRAAAFLDPANTPDTPVTTFDANGNPTPNPALTGVNRQFGRVFKVTSFRWLNKTEL